MTDFDISTLRAISVGDGADVFFTGNPVPVDYDSVKDEFVVQVRPFETDRIRLVLGARHNRSADLWRMPATRTQAAALSGVFAGRLTPTDGAREYVRRLFTLYGGTPDADMSHNLFPFQRAGVLTLTSAGSALLGDDMGLGKTIQAIEWMRVGGWATLPNLIICTNSMKYKWQSEILTWWPETDVVVVDGTAKQRAAQITNDNEPRQGPVVLIINYESLRSHTKLAPWGGKALTAKQKVPGALNEFTWGHVVVDEAHKIKDPGAQQTMAVKQMGLQAKKRLAMTGTPVLNSPDDLWSIMSFVAPDEWGSRNQFRNRYCNMASAWHGGFENLGLKPETRAEFDRFFLPRFVRRTKVEVLPDLPDKLPIDYRILPVSGKQAAIYNALVKDFMVMIEGDLLTADNPLALTTRLRQVACAVPVVGEQGGVVELTAPSNKLDAILDLLDEAPGEPLVVYADSRKFIELLEIQLSKKGLKCGMITGLQSAAVRERSVKAFQDGKLDLILGTLGAGAEGITLTRANRIVLAQQSWSHGTNAQAIDRVHRIGQGRGVHPIVLISEGTIDHAVAQVDRMKEGRLQELVRDPAWLKAAARGEIR